MRLYEILSRNKPATKKKCLDNKCAIIFSAVHLSQWVLGGSEGPHQEHPAGGRDSEVRGVTQWVPGHQEPQVLQLSRLCCHVPEEG